MKQNIATAFCASYLSALFLSRCVSDSTRGYTLGALRTATRTTELWGSVEERGRERESERGGVTESERSGERERELERDVCRERERKKKLERERQRI